MHLPLHCQFKKMLVKETIAIIGSANKSCKELCNRLAIAHYPLVFVTKERASLALLAHQISTGIPHADISTVDCAKEGCWQADIVILCSFQEDYPELLQKIASVTTQKILVIFSEKKAAELCQENFNTFRAALPNTAIVSLCSGSDSRTMQLIDCDDEAGVIITRILKELSYSFLNEQEFPITLKESSKKDNKAWIMPKR